ncbi:MAG: hypothetical protein M1835_006758 [Candelina submexicana]|nr:MAG: hypothetical protein M1835_006758 [Candelina submexicana]
MAQEELEYQVEQLIGYESVSVLRSALERCRDGRYRMRDRREQLLGDFVDTWQDLHLTLRRANLALKQLRYRSTRDRAYRVIQEATALSRRAVTSLSSCLPVPSMTRAREQEEKFLFNIARDYDLATLLSDMPAMGERVKLAVQSCMREDQDILLASQPRGSRDDVYTSGGYIDDGYDSYTSSRNSSTRALPSAYGSTHTTPRITYAAPIEDYETPMSELDYVYADTVYREPRVRGYSNPLPRRYVFEGY